MKSYISNVVRAIDRRIGIETAIAICVMIVGISAGASWRLLPHHENPQPSNYQPLLPIVAESPDPTNQPSAPVVAQQPPAYQPAYHDWDADAQRNHDQAVESIQRLGYSKAESEQWVKRAEHTAKYGPEDSENARREQSRKDAGW